MQPKPKMRPKQLEWQAFNEGTITEVHRATNIKGVNIGIYAFRTSNYTRVFYYSAVFLDITTHYKSLELAKKRLQDKVNALVALLAPFAEPTEPNESPNQSHEEIKN